jgi:hypothetical protein
VRAETLDDLGQKTDALAMNHDYFSRNTRNQLKQVFDALRDLMTPPIRPSGLSASSARGQGQEDDGGKRQDLTLDPLFLLCHKSSFALARPQQGHCPRRAIR